MTELATEQPAGSGASFSASSIVQRKSGGEGLFCFRRLCLLTDSCPAPHRPGGGVHRHADATPIRGIDATTEGARSVLRADVDRYNNRRVHSTTGEIPSVRFDKVREEGRSLFPPFALPKPYRSAKDVFCLRETRMVDGYRRMAVYGHRIEIPQAGPREEVNVHFVPDIAQNVMEIRIWWVQKMVHTTVFPLSEFMVHLCVFKRSLFGSAAVCGMAAQTRIDMADGVLRDPVPVLC